MPGEKFLSRLPLSLKSSVAILPLAAAFCAVAATAQNPVAATAPPENTVTADAPPLPADTKAEARAKKKAETARKIAERDAREAAEYVPLGSHVRDAAAGSSVRTMSKDELARREAGKNAGEVFGESIRVPVGPSDAEILTRLGK